MTFKELSEIRTKIAYTQWAIKDAKIAKSPKIRKHELDKAQELATQALEMIDNSKQ